MGCVKAGGGQQIHAGLNVGTDAHLPSNVVDLYLNRIDILIQLKTAIRCIQTLERRVTVNHGTKQYVMSLMSQYSFVVNTVVNTVQFRSEYSYIRSQYSYIV